MTSRRTTARPVKLRSSSANGGIVRSSATSLPGPVANAARSIRSPFTSRSVTPTPWNRWTPLLTIASNTGCTSVGELLMTFRISAVAVCCSSASVSSRFRACNSLKSRAFSIAITAWSAKVLSSAISFSENSPTIARPTKIDADAAPLPQHRREDHRLCCRRSWPTPHVFGHVRRLDVGVVHDAALQDRRPGARLLAQRNREVPHQAPPVGTVVGAQVYRAVIADEADAHVPAREEPLAALQDLLEHRLRVRHRARDHLEHLGGSLLMVERLLRLVEEAHVLDRDHRLVGEGLEQRDLLLGERPRPRRGGSR